MKRLLAICVTYTGLLFVPAFAADPVTTVVEYDTVETYSWDGPYVGLYLGYGAWVAKVEELEEPCEEIYLYGCGSPGFTKELGGQGPVLGGVLGFMYPITPSIAAAIEGRYGWANMTGSGSIGDFASLESKAEWTGDIVAKGGYTNDRTFIYGLLGWGWMGANVDVAFGPFAASYSQTFDGWQTGFGISRVLYDNVILSAEYRYTGYGSQEIAPGYIVDPSSHTGTVNLVYKFTGFPFGSRQ